MKILLITNPNVEEVIEDKWLADAFIADGHEVIIVDKNYPVELEEDCDVFLKRNCWSPDEKDFVLGQASDVFQQRLVAKNLPRINCDGKFDGSGKSYLCQLFREGLPVIPSVQTPADLERLPKQKYYLLKPLNGLDGFGIKQVTATDISKLWNEYYIIQPKLDFVAEVQFYFVGNKFEYALEYKPSKVPLYPKPTQYKYSKNELSLAQKFADLSPNYNGVQRIDFLKLSSGELKLLEIEDSSPYLELNCVPQKVRDKFIQDYKQMVYDYLKTF